MRVRFLYPAIASLAFATSLCAQVQDKPAVIHATDGGYDGPLQSIFVPPKPGAPFSLTLSTEWTRTINNGTIWQASFSGQSHKYSGAGSWHVCRARRLQDCGQA